MKKLLATLTLLSLALPLWASASLGSGLGLYLPLDVRDGSRGTTVYDRSGNGNLGTYTGTPTVVAGKMGQALAFGAGLGSPYITIPHSSSYKSASQSLTFWIYPTLLPANNYFGIVDIFQTDGNAMECFINSGTSNLSCGSFSWSMVYTLTPNHWYFVDLQAVSGSGTLYVNAVAVQQGSLSYDGTTNTGPLQIGSRENASYPFTGYIDDVRVYNRVLSQAEITQLYRQGGGTSNTNSFLQSILSALGL